MQHFSVEGHWWLPDHTERRVSGTLNFTADGLELVLYEQLRHFPEPGEGEVVTFEPGEWSTTPIVHGQTREWKDVTLFSVEGVPFNGAMPGSVRESYRVTLALIGCHTEVNSFSGALVEFDKLNSWADAPSIVDDVLTRGPRVEVRVENVKLAEVAMDDSQVELHSGAVGNVGTSRVHLDQSADFRTEFHSPLSAEEIVESNVRPLQDLLIFSLGRVVRLTSLQLRPAESGDVRSGYCDAYFNAIQPLEEQGEASRTSPWSYSEPTLMTAGNSPLPLGDLIASWFRLWREMRDVIVPLHAPFYASFMYSENRFASVFQSAEALHKRRFESREVSKSAHKNRVRAIIGPARRARVDAETLAWADRVLTSRNDKPLRMRIDELVRSTGAVGVAVYAANPKFAELATYARTGVSHGGRLTGSEQNIRRFWHGMVLNWVLRSRLLLDLGVPLNEVERRTLARGAFHHALQQMQASIEQESEPDKPT
ncbi:HEPN domain-containing protein [Kribbella sp. NPDC004536]|uniref:ApeA N-terminal domain 1-containing protein n=1 Tax=Kribbella sp. NPDC004536 TaxID=3364106 RepID=UPI0036792430